MRASSPNSCSNRSLDLLRLHMLLAKILRGAWRATPPPLDFTESELASVLPLLKHGHLHALAWWRIRGSLLAKTSVGSTIHQEYVTQSILAATATHRVHMFVSELRAHDIEAIVFKGWAVFAHYAEPGLRPAGDVDLAVAPQDAPRAVEILKRFGAGPTEMDVHPGLDDPAHAAYIPGARWEELLARSETRKIGGLDVRVLNPEDELQVLCIHCIRHFGRRPIWLTDIAAALEARPTDMDWARVLSKPPYASWILYAVLLAHELLGANLAGTPFAVRTKELPAWLVRDVLERWTDEGVQRPMLHDSILQVWRSPSRWGDAARARLPNQFEAAVDFHGGLDERFLARYQMRAAWRRLASFSRRNFSRGE